MAGTSTPLTQQISDRTTDNEISTPKHELTSLSLQRSIIDSAAHGRTRDWDQRRLKSLGRGEATHLPCNCRGS